MRHPIVTRLCGVCNYKIQGIPRKSPCKSHKFSSTGRDEGPGGRLRGWASAAGYPWRRRSADACKSAIFGNAAGQLENWDVCGWQPPRLCFVPFCLSAGRFRACDIGHWYRMTTDLYVGTKDGPAGAFALCGNKKCAARYGETETNFLNIIYMLYKLVNSFSE